MKKLLLLLAACGSHPSQADCEKIAAHMITIFTAPKPGEDGKVPRDVQTATDAWQKNLLEKERDPTKETLVKVCRTDMASGATSCILDAADEVALSKCFGG